MNKWRIGAFYTKDTPYEDIYHNILEDSCKRLGLEDKLIPMEIPNRGNWYKNTAQKPRVVIDFLSCLEEGESLVLLDADASIEEYPVLFDTIPLDYEIAYHTLSWIDWYGHKTETLELLSGTMFFRNTSAVEQLCIEWFNKSQKELKWEQKVLQEIIPQHKVKHYPLPIEYCFMKDRPGNLPPLVQAKPIILHHQVSRDLKKGKI